MSALDKYTIVEGVETHQQYKILEKIGFTCFQGYFFAVPETVEEVTETIKIANSLRCE
jgi:EAL domain-containing protein (putative c-di-GMP-specific phosphodiesterase class I)